VPSGTTYSESTVERFTEPKDWKFVPSLENSTPTLELPLKVRAPKLTDQLLPVSGMPVRSASNTTLAEDGAIIESELAEIWDISSSRTVQASKSTIEGASRFESSEPPTAALGRNSSEPLPAATLVEPKAPFAYIVPKAADSRPAPKVGSRSE
jgi:hypothetical protein